MPDRDSGFIYECFPSTSSVIPKKNVYIKETIALITYLVDKHEKNKMKLSTAILMLALVVGAYCNCGCLKVSSNGYERLGFPEINPTLNLQCSKHLKVVSPPRAPIKVIYSGNPCFCPKKISYSVEIPVVPPPPVPTCKTYGYQVSTVKIQFNYVRTKHTLALLVIANENG